MRAVLEGRVTSVRETRSYRRGSKARRFAEDEPEPPLVVVVAVEFGDDLDGSQLDLVWKAEDGPQPQIGTTVRVTVEIGGGS